MQGAARRVTVAERDDLGAEAPGPGAALRDWDSEKVNFKFDAFVFRVRRVRKSTPKMIRTVALPGLSQSQAQLWTLARARHSSLLQ